MRVPIGEFRKFGKVRTAIRELLGKSHPSCEIKIYKSAWKVIIYPIGWLLRKLGDKPLNKEL